MVTSWCPCQQRPSDYGIPMDVEMAYVQDSFLTNDILHEMVSSLLGGMGAPCGGAGGGGKRSAGLTGHRVGLRKPWLSVPHLWL